MESNALLIFEIAKASSKKGIAILNDHSIGIAGIGSICQHKTEYEKIHINPDHYCINLNRRQRLEDCYCLYRRTTLIVGKKFLKYCINYFSMKENFNNHRIEMKIATHRYHNAHCNSYSSLKNLNFVWINKLMKKSISNVIMRFVNCSKDESLFYKQIPSTF